MRAINVRSANGRSSRMKTSDGSGPTPATATPRRRTAVSAASGTRSSTARRCHVRPAAAQSESIERVLTSCSSTMSGRGRRAASHAPWSTAAGPTRYATFQLTTRSRRSVGVVSTGPSSHRKFLSRPGPPDSRASNRTVEVLVQPLWLKSSELREGWPYGEPALPSNFKLGEKTEDLLLTVEAPAVPRDRHVVCGR